MAGEPKKKPAGEEGAAREAAERGSFARGERERLLERERAARAEAERARQETRAILESISDGFFALDRERRFVYLNREAERFWGKPREELLGKDIWKLFPQEVGTEGYRAIERVAKEGVASEFEAASSVVPGAWVAGRVYPSAEGLSVYFRDVTERKRAEEERARISAIVESSDDVIIGKTLEGTITSWNKGAERIYGYSAEEAVGQPISMLVPPDRPNEIPHILERLRRGEKVDHFETVRLAKDGRRLDISLTVSPIRNSAGDIVGASTIARDITESKRAKDALKQVKEAERRRLAHDLHDGVLQDLSYTAASLGMMMLQAEDKELEDQLQGAVDAVRRAAQELREAVNDLRLEGEEKRPFPELVEALVNRQRAMAKGACEVSLELDEGLPLTPLGEIGAQSFRILQEALTNARRHSGAKTISVSVKREGNDLVAEVSDDGRGFGPDTAPGVGQGSMRERAAAIGGELEIKSESGRGTRVQLRAPLPQEI